MIALGDDKIFFLQNSTFWEIVQDNDPEFDDCWDIYYFLFVKLDGQKVKVAHSSNYRALKKFMRTAAANVNKDISLKEFLEQDFAKRYPDLVAKINLNYG